MSLRFPTFSILACAAALALAAGGAAPAGAQTSPLPSLGEAASEGLSASEERRLGDEIMRQIRADPDYLDDPVLLDYLQSQWLPLKSAARRQGEMASDQQVHGAWEVFLLRDRSVNAFALPGGYVGVYLGMVALTATPEELASVLAHEMSHVTQRHIARMLGTQSRQSMMGLAAMVLGVLAASKNPTAASAIVVSGQAALMQGQLNFSRDMEREADRVGFGLMGEAGFPPAGMAEMFEKLAQSSRLTDDQSLPWLRTHPLTTERIAEARARAVSGAMARPALSLLEHAVMRGRAQVLMDPKAQSLSRLASARPEPGATPAARLTMASAAALAAARMRDAAAADAALAQARTLASGDAAARRRIDLLGAELLIERGEGARALQVLGGPEGQGTRAEVWLTARAALSGGEADWRRSAEALQTRVTDAPDDATLWALLAQTAQKLGQPLRAVRAEAESRRALGDLAGAVDRLKAGQRLARTQDAEASMDAAVIDARLKVLQARRDEEMRERGRNGNRR